MSRFVRASKVRHVYCDQPKAQEVYGKYNLTTAAGDHQFIKANAKYMGIPIKQANGALTIVPMDIPEEERKTDGGILPCLDGHKGPVLDFDFHPFEEQLLMTGGDDCVIKLWGIPPDGLKESISDALGNMAAHDKKVSAVLNHPTVPYVMASGSADRTVKVWNVETQQFLFSVDHGELVQGIDWDKYGEVLASTGRDKKVRVIDGRTGDVVSMIKAHDGARTAKCIFTPGKNLAGNALVTIGFDRQSKRQFKLWDTRKMDKHVSNTNIDQAAGSMMPFWDEATELLFLAGKGDANVRYYELVDAAPWNFYISEFRTTIPCRGMCAVPRRAVDTTKCEITRLMKLTGNEVHPLSFICPRKSDLFQADLFPDCFSGKVAPGSPTADDYFKGAKGKLQLCSMDPKDNLKTTKVESATGSVKKAAAPPPPAESAASVPSPSGPVAVAAAPKKNMADLKQELAFANRELERLRDLLKKNHIQY